MKIFECLLRKRNTKRTFLWPKNTNLASIGKKIDLNMNPSNWLFVLDIEDGMQDIQLWEAILRTYYYN